MFAHSAHAYIDPGSGSMMIQALIAVIAAVGTSLGVFRTRVNKFLQRIFGKKRDAGDDSKHTNK